MPRRFVGATPLLVLTLVACLATGAIVACDSTPPGPRSGETLFTEVGCINCHGVGGMGIAGFAPTLHGKMKYWTRETVIAYVKDPQGYAARDPRLREQGRGYSLPMPKVVLENPIEYENLADYVLAIP